MTASTEPRIIPYDPAWYAAYARFAEAAWGAGCYQASRRYLRWLCDEHPEGQAQARPRLRDRLIAVVGTEVVGAVHNLRLTWRLGAAATTTPATQSGELVEIPSPHNWFVVSEHRRGLGLMLLNAAQAGERHAFTNVADGPLTELYRKLRYEEVRTEWWQKPLRPAAAALRTTISRVFGERAAIPLHDRGGWRRFVAAPPDPGGGFLVDAAPSAELQAALLACRERTPRAGATPTWTPATFAWRFFHRFGPRHVAVYARRGSPQDALGPDAIHSCALLSLGLRRGLLLARLIEVAAPEAQDLAPLLRAAERTALRLGAHALLYYGSNPRTLSAVAATGLRRREASPAFVYHAARKERFGGVDVEGSVADFGFESIGSWD